MPTSPGVPSAGTLQIPSDEELQNMPLDQLEQLVLQATDEVNAALQGRGIDLGPGAGAVGPTPSGMGEPGGGLSLVTPELLGAVSEVLVALGVLSEPVQEMSPDFMEMLTVLAEHTNPGVYNLQNEDDLVEFLNGIATGLIAIPDLSGGAAPGGLPPAGPEGQPIGGPPTGAVPGGVPGTAPAAGPGIIPGT